MSFRCLVPLVLAASMAAPTAHASIISYRFTADISLLSLWDMPTNTGTSPTQTTFPGFLVDSSWTITGIASYDTTAPLDSFQAYMPGGGQHVRYVSANGTGLTFTFSGGPGGFSTAGNHILEFANDASDMAGMDAFYVSGNPASDGSGFRREASIVFNDFTGAALTSADIATNLSMDGFGFRQFGAMWETEIGRLWVYAPLTSWQRVEDTAQVPEPFGLSLVAVGLCVVGAASRKKAIARS